MPSHGVAKGKRELVYNCQNVPILGLSGQRSLEIHTQSFEGLRSLTEGAFWRFKKLWLQSSARSTLTYGIFDVF